MPTAVTGRQLSNVVPPRAAARLRAFRREAENALPGMVERVVLFGSRARGDARSDSDYDVAVFVWGMTDRRPIDHALADTAYPHILAGFHIRPLAVPAEYLERPRAHALVREITREGIVVS
ncbi:MAG: nucleotidyltransferase domain-containing protein [Xanthobacteraceae bacterium]|nr:nucleotidyltransferase domain-containing protein [Xanthobacteraceae bacterium]